MENIIYCKNVLNSYKYQNKHNVLKTTMIHVTYMYVYRNIVVSDDY